MGARYYESNTSGLNVDRFLDHFDESTLSTMKRHYWTAKQMLRTKLGTKEDEHLLASDADLDSKLTLFRSIQNTSGDLLTSIEGYSSYLYDAILCENELGRYLKDQGKCDKRQETAAVMVAVGRAFLYASHQRLAFRQPIVRFTQELQVFAERAIADCAQTVEAVERARLAYRGSLLWIKNTSAELDPDADKQLEKFREAQMTVRTNKEKLDKLKVDTLQKVDLLSASRSSLLSHLLGTYLQMLASYYEKTAKAYSALANNLSVFQHYEFEILTQLIEPSKKVAKHVRQQSLEQRKRESIDAEEAADTVEPLLQFESEGSEEMKKYLFGRESPSHENETVDEVDRADSPLGIIEEGVDVVEQNDMCPAIGPLVEKPVTATSEIPKLKPPPKNCQTIATTSALLELEDMPLYEEELFPKMPAKERARPAQSSIVDLLGLNLVTSAKHSNPLDKSRATEWDLLLSQCDDANNTSDLL